MATDLGTLFAGFDRRLKAIERSSRLSSASLDDTALEARDADGGLRALIGKQTDGTTAANFVNGPVPPAPSAPVVASVLGGVTVSWDGQFADSAVLPLDWSRIEVHASPIPGFSPMAATLQSTIETPQGATVVVPCDGDVYVRMLARTTSGTASTATAEVGPFGPAPVVASELLDGIVTELKLANDAVTAAKIAASAVGTTEIADDAVTTQKIIAGAILAGQIAAGAVITDKLAAEAVTAAKIAALAITTDKLAANAITASKIQAGAVDATALAADAITGKTITGGTITGTLIQTDTTGQRVAINEADANKIIVYDPTDRAVGEFSDAGVLLEGENGALIHLDPDGTYPNLRLTNDDQSNEAVINVVENTPGSANLGLNSGLFTAHGYSDMKWRTFLGEDFYAAERFRESNSATVIGGRVYMNGSGSHLQFLNADTPSQNSGIDIAANIAQCNSRLEVLPPNASNLSVLFGNAASGHTGNMMRLQKNLVDMAVVDNSGNATFAGYVNAGASNKVDYTPTVGGGGTATFSTRSGWSVDFGDLVYWNAHLVVSAAGSGTATVTITSPSAPDRTLRQICTMSAEGVKVSGLFAAGYLTAITTGSGSVWDRMATQDNGATNRLTIIQGSHLLSGCQIVIQGFYIKA
ncbi:hypothetical protein [Streptomyces sp. NPDC005407]|uniref:hypothetical protein n=1 Tax=Streptomyces sp. NPDC005407 TaxID=3155340 RepID=UPI0033AD3A2E